MERVEELEILLKSVISKLSMTAVTYGIRSSTFRGWLEDMNALHEEFFKLTNRTEAEIE